MCCPCKVCFLLFQRPQPSIETKTLTPKFDLLASNFPPLPGSVVKTQEDPVLESRMSDIVKGISKEKVYTVFRLLFRLLRS